MLRLAVATTGETATRMVEPLSARDIAVEQLPTTGRTFPLGEALGSYDVGFVFPPRLAEGGVADALLDIPWVNDREAVLRSRHKGEALARLTRAGIPIPETVVVSNPVDEAELRDVYHRFDPPVVVKPNATTRGAGIAKAHDLDSFLGICDYLDLVHDYRATGDRSFLVQEFLEQPRDFRVMVVDGECVGAVERQRPATDPDEATSEPESTGAEDGRWKHNVHQGADATPVDLPDELATLAENVAAALDIPWLGVDLLVTDDRTVVSETNARPTIDDAEKYDDGFWDAVASLVRRQ